MKLKRLIIVGLILLSGQAVRSQYNCLFEHYSTEDGLSHGSVSDIIRDSKGFMWFSTFDGINKFDGYNFTTYKARPGDKTPLSSNRVILLMEDKWGFIWLQTYDSSVYRFNPRLEIFESVLKTTDGAPISVKRVYKSSLDDIWLITGHSGLYRIATNPEDYTYRVFHYKYIPGQTFSLCSNTILSIFEDHDRHIWISTDKGLNSLHYDAVKNSYSYRVFSPAVTERLKPYHFSAFAEQNGKIWMGTREGVMFFFDPVSEEIHRAALDNDRPVTSIMDSDSSSLFIGTSGNGILRYRVADNRISDHSRNNLLNNVISIFIDSRGLLWIETEKDGVMKLNQDFSGFKHFRQPTDVDLTYQPRSACGFLEDEKGVLWISLKGGGFGYYNRNNDNLEYFFNRPGDPSARMSNYVNCFYKDQGNVLWLSTYYKGIEKITFPENKFRFIRFTADLQSMIPNEVRSIYEDSKGYLWVGTKNGTLYLLDQEKNIIRQYTSEIGHGMVYSIMEDKEKNIWLGTKGKGLFKAEKTRGSKADYRFKNYRHDPDYPGSLNSDLIYSVIQDSKGRIWIGTFGQGLNLLVIENEKVYFKNINNSLRHYPKDKCRRIRFIEEDSRGLLWIATTEGLLLLDPEQGTPDSYVFNHYEKVPGNESSLGSNDIYCIFSDRTDSIWLGTLGGGLHKLITYPANGRSPEFRIIGKKDGLPSDVVLSIEADRNNNLWLSTENGIAHLNRMTGIIKRYDEYDGLQLSSFSEATSFTRSNGEILFGTMEGLYAFFAEDFTDEAVTINLVLTRFKIFNKDIVPGTRGSPLKSSITETDEIRLNHKQSMFSIEYTGLDYSAQHKMQYAYMLEGLDPPDSGWHYVNNQRTATYTNIPPGKYRFRVRFVNPDLKGKNPERTLSITVLPPPWKTKWATAVYIVLLLLLLEMARRIIFTMIRLRNKVTVEREIVELKLRFFTNISHELRTPLTLIIGPVEEIIHSEKLSSKGLANIKLVEKNTKRLLKFINQLLDFRKAQNDKMVLKLTQVDLIMFVREIVANFRELAVEKNIDFKFSTDIDHLNIWMDKEKMDIVIFNLLSNAFKFTPAGRRIEANIRVLKHQDAVCLEVRDEGIGIPAEKTPLIFKRFAALHDPKNVRNIGTGIGLSLSKELIDLHSGSISFESKEGEGTKFTVILKQGKSHFHKEKVEFVEDQAIEEITKTSGEDVLTAVPLKDASGIKTAAKDKPMLLIVEDNDDLRKFLGHQFSENFIVKEAENGQEGYVKARNLIPDIILSDVMMPVMDGIELLNSIKNDFTTSHIPVILLTAKSSVENRIEGLKYGADAYITKPFNLQYLQASVINLLEQRKMLLHKFSGHVRVLDFARSEIMVTDKDNEFLQNITGIIEENISNPDFKIEDIAQSLGLGRTSFFKKIKSLTGRSPIDFVNEFRLEKAAGLLEIGDYNISEISYRCGFSDPGYFSKRFRERFGMAPSDYRKRKRNR